MLEKIYESAAHDLKTGRDIAQEHIRLDLDTESRLGRWHRGVNDISLRIVIQSKHRFHIDGHRCCPEYASVVRYAVTTLPVCALVTSTTTTGKLPRKKPLVLEEP
jgi:hypothetical protein